MQSYILIADNLLSFEKIEEILKEKFDCSKVSDNRLSIECKSEHLFIDFDNSIKNDYEENELQNNNGNFYLVLFNSEDFFKSVLGELKQYNIVLDNDEGEIKSLSDYLG